MVSKDFKMYSLHIDNRQTNMGPHSHAHHGTVRFTVNVGWMWSAPQSLCFSSLSFWWVLTYLSWGWNNKKRWEWAKFGKSQRERNERLWGKERQRWAMRTLLGPLWAPGGGGATRSGDEWRDEASVCSRVPGTRRSPRCPREELLVSGPHTSTVAILNRQDMLSNQVHHASLF